MDESTDITTILIKDSVKQKCFDRGMCLSLIGYCFILAIFVGAVLIAYFYWK